MNKVILEDIGESNYKEVWDYQEKLLHENVQRKRNGEPTINHLLFTEHAPVYTLGKNGNTMHALLTEQQRQQKGIEYFHINRGGDITFHGPGQLVGYPIIDLDKFKTD